MNTRKLVNERELLRLLSSFLSVDFKNYLLYLKDSIYRTRVLPYYPNTWGMHLIYEPH